MKLIYFFTFITLPFLISCHTTSSTSNDISLGDTIKTKSGLQYFYVKQGTGRRVEAGAEVGTYLSLMVNDSVVWNSADSPDSLFTFIAGYTRLIKGFNEITMFLREGDQVAAILPDSLAYGVKGAGDIIPPHSTLFYNEFKVVKVGEPKGILADTLFMTLQSSGMEDMMKRYKQITTTSDSSRYHRGNDQLYRLCDNLNKGGMHQKAAEVASCFADITQDNKLWYKMVLSFESMGHLKQAKESLGILIEKEPHNKVMKTKMDELEEKLSLKYK